MSDNISTQFNVDASGLKVEEYLDLLVKGGVLNNEDLSGFKQKYQNPEQIFEALDSMGVHSNDKLVEIYAKFLQIPFIKLQVIDEKAKQLIDPNLSLRFGFVPFMIDEKSRSLQVAITDPSKFKNLNPNAISQLEQKLNLNIELFMAGKESASKLMLQDDVQPKVDQTQTINQVSQQHEVELEVTKPTETKTEVTQPQPAQKHEEINLNEIEIPDEILQKMPYDLANKFQAVIFRKESNNTFDMAAVDPTDKNLADIVDFVEKKGNIKLNLFKVQKEQIDSVLERYNKKSDEPEITKEEPNEELESIKPADIKFEAKKSFDMENPDLSVLLQSKKADADDIKRYANSEQIPQLVAAILLFASLQRASDIHIEPFEKSVRVRYRVDGELADIALVPSALSSSIVARIKILSKLKLDEQRVPQDGRFDVAVSGSQIDIRVSTLPTVYGEKLVMRLLAKDHEMDKLEDLGVDGLGYDRIISAIAKPYGVILSTGPTGSGKTTSLYSVLTRLNRPEVNIITLEDPVEYELQGINQVQVKPQIGFGFAEGLRSVLRQDPNIIMVGEIRDADTAELVTHAALTGHLVLSTLHTNDASGALPRLYNLGVEPFLLTSAINAIIGQRLVRRVCSKCRVEVQVPQSVSFEVKKELTKLNLNIPLKFFKGKGCPDCKDGFSGRIGIFEVLTMSSKIEELVLTKKSSDEIFTQALKEGMITMRQDGFIKAVKGLTTVDEVLRVTSQSKEG